MTNRIGRRPTAPLRPSVTQFRFCTRPPTVQLQKYSRTGAWSMDQGYRKLILAQCGLALSLLGAAAVADNPWHQRIQALAASKVHIVSVEDEAGRMVIQGTASNTSDVSAFMRTLSDNVGSPSLEILTSGLDGSEFTMTVKKPAS